MKTINFTKYLVAVVAAFGLVLQVGACLAADEKTDNKPTTIDVSKVRIPEIYGTIKEAHKGNDKVIFYIQDAHCNLEAQQNIERIAQDLMNQYGIDVVCSEGQVGTADDLAKMANAKNKAVRDDMANYYLEKGMFGGMDHLRATTDKPFTLYGLEDAALNKENDDAFRKTAAYQKEAAAQITELNKTLGLIAQKNWSPDLKAFVDKVADYRAGKIKFTEFSQALRDVAAKQGVDISAQKNLDLQGKSFAMEGKINFDAVEDERAAIVDEVSKKLSKEEASNLVVQSLSFRLGRLNAVEYYDILKGLCDKAGVDMKAKTNLAAYIDYINVFDQINKDALVDEANAVTAAIKDKLFASDDQRNLDKMITHLDMIARMFNVKLGIRDYRVYVKNAAEVKLPAVLELIKAQAPAAGIAVPAVDVATLENYVAGIDDFYAIAAKRDDVMLKNTVTLMNDKKLDKMIMVTGGFHTAAIADQLKKAGFSVIVITPRITNFDVKSPYADVMLGKVPMYWAAKAKEVEAELKKPGAPGGSDTDPDQGSAAPAKLPGPTIEHNSAVTVNGNIIAGTPITTLPADLAAAVSDLDTTGITFTEVAGNFIEYDVADASGVAIPGQKTIAYASIGYKPATATEPAKWLIGMPEGLLATTDQKLKDQLIEGLRKDIVKLNAFKLLGYDPTKLREIPGVVTAAEATRQQHIRRVADLMGLMAERSDVRRLDGLKYFTETPEGIAELIKMASRGETDAVIAKAVASIDAVFADTAIPTAGRLSQTQVDQLKAFQAAFAAKVQAYLPLLILEGINANSASASVLANPALPQDVVTKINALLADQAKTDTAFAAGLAAPDVAANVAAKKGPAVNFETGQILAADGTTVVNTLDAQVKAACEGGAFPGYKYLGTTATPEQVKAAAEQLYREALALKDLKSYEKLVGALAAIPEAQRAQIVANLPGLIIDARNLAEYEVDTNGNIKNYSPKTASAFNILEHLTGFGVKVAVVATDLKDDDELDKLLERCLGIDKTKLPNHATNFRTIVQATIAGVQTQVDGFLPTGVDKSKVCWLAHKSNEQTDRTEIKAAGYKIFVGQNLLNFDVLVTLAMKDGLGATEAQRLLVAAGATEAEAVGILGTTGRDENIFIPPVQETKSVMAYIESNPRSVDVAA